MWCNIWSFCSLLLVSNYNNLSFLIAINVINNLKPNTCVSRSLTQLTDFITFLLRKLCWMILTVLSTYSTIIHSLLEQVTHSLIVFLNYHKLQFSSNLNVSVAVTVLGQHLIKTWKHFNFMFIGLDWNKSIVNLFSCWRFKFRIGKVA